MRIDPWPRGVAPLTLSCFALSLATPALGQELPPPPELPLYQPPPAPAYGYPAQPGYPVQPPVYGQPGPRVPVRYDLKPRYGLIAGGSAVLGALWLITAVAGLGTVIVSDVCNAATSTAGCPTAAWPLFVPVAGPFLQMAYVSGAGANTARVLLAFDGILQLGGLAMIIAGALSKKRVPVYAERFQLTPYALGGGGGLLAQGRF